LSQENEPGLRPSFAMYFTVALQRYSLIDATVRPPM
jgi:hypothetical protein